ncbi:MAG: tetratricopeptide repeat protein [Bacteroidota bacterium]
MSNEKKEVVKHKPKKIAQPPTKNRLWVFILLSFTFIIYGNTVGNEYALDDGIVINLNDFVQEGFAGIKDILTHDSFYGWAKGANNDVAGGRYRPLSLVSFAIEHQFAGNNAHFSHFINVLLFALTGIFIFLLLQQLLLHRPTKYAELVHLPFLAALLFIAHPIHTEAVANIKGRDEILSLLFSILASINFIRYVDDGRKMKNIVFGFIFFFLALLSKENAITFALIIPMMLWFFRSENMKSFVPVLVSIVISSGIFLLLRQAFSNTSINKEVTDLMNNPFFGMTVTQKYATIIYTFGKYLLLLLLPFNLTNDYYPYQITIHDFSSIGTIISLVVCVTVLVIAFMHLRKKTILSFSILYFAVTLSVVSNLVFPVGTFMSERFLFMPSLAFCLLLAYCISLIPFYRFNRFPFQKNTSTAVIVSNNFFRTRSIQYLLVLILGAYSVKTIARNAVWKNNFSLFSEDINNSPNSAMAHHAIAAEYRKAGEQSTDNRKQTDFYNRAIEEDNKALAIHPKFIQAYYNIGVTYLEMHDVNAAETALRKAIAIAPNYADALNNLGYCFIQKNKLDSAIILCNSASKIDTNYFRPYSNLGAIYLKKMDTEKAYFYFQKAHTLEPNDAATTKAFEDLSDLIQHPN